MTLVWREPPVDPRRVFNQSVLAELRKNPGEWALIRDYNSRNSRFVREPPEDIEIHWQYHEKRAQLYARARV